VEKRKLQRSAKERRMENSSRKRRTVLAKAAAAITAGWLTFSSSTELFNSYTPMPLAFIH
jgi:hypothetical protein